MDHQRIARTISFPVRNMLVAHVHGPRRITNGNERQTIASLRRYGLLRPCTENGAPIGRTAVAAYTALTEDGRAVLGHVLGEFADGLIAAGVLDMEVARAAADGVRLSLTPGRYGRGDQERADDRDPVEA